VNRVLGYHWVAPEGQLYWHRFSAVYGGQVHNVFRKELIEELPETDLAHARRELGRHLSLRYQDKFEVTMQPAHVCTKDDLLKAVGLAPPRLDA
jgi:hypothetical protein